MRPKPRRAELEKAKSPIVKIPDRPALKKADKKFGKLAQKVARKNEKIIEKQLETASEKEYRLLGELESLLRNDPLASLYRIPEIQQRRRQLRMV